ncbi:MAG: hypothetical protein IJX70_00520 [Clostridia bacterium]|nr:hypothetical protein [Clostridia bacterium]
MDRIAFRDNLCYYLCAGALLLTCVLGMCTLAIYAATGGVGLGLALWLVALILSCVAYSSTSLPVRRRVRDMLISVLAVGLFFVIWFIAFDLCHASVRRSLLLPSGEAQNRLLGMGVVCLVYQILCLLFALLTVLRVVCAALGRPLYPCERIPGACATSVPETGEVEPLATKSVEAVVADAERVIKTSRLSVQEESPSSLHARAVVSPGGVREQLRRRVVEAESVAEEAPVALSVAEEEVSAPVEEPIVIAEEPILAEEPIEMAGEVIYAEGGVSEAIETMPIPDMADSDIRAEYVVHHPKHKAHTEDDSLYSDFDYSSGEEDE